MDEIKKDYFDMAYATLESINKRGLICTPKIFSLEASILYRSQAKKYPLILEHLSRALRELPRRNPKIKKLRRGQYLIRRYEDTCELHIRMLKCQELME